MAGILVDRDGGVEFDVAGGTVNDVLNATFETLGALLTWVNVRRTHTDKGYAGIYLPAVVLFTIWGYWNLYYYPTLGQWYSFGATVIMVAANSCWVGLMCYYGELYT